MTKLSMLVLSGLFFASLVVVALAQTELTPVEEKRIIRDIEQKERELSRFHGQIRKLESAARRSSNSSRRPAIENLQKSMSDVILATEELLGEDYRITKHGSDVDQVSKSDLERSSGVRTRNRVWISRSGENAPPPEYIRLMRQQSIFVSCKTILEQAISAQSSALDSYQSLVKEFAMLMEDEIIELQNKLPPDPEKDAEY